MKPAEFDYTRPADLNAVLALLAEGGETRILAGGQSLVPMMNLRLARPGRLVDINRLQGLDHIRLDGGHLVIGALARHADVMAAPLVARHAPLMHAAYEWVAHAAVRNRGTLCGNLCHADPASEMPAVMLACEATLVARSRSGERRISAADFFIGPFTTALRSDEMLVEVRVPVRATAEGHGFHEVSQRRGDFAWASVAVLMRCAGDRVQHVAIAVAGVDTCALRLHGVEAALIGAVADAAAFERAGTAAAAAVNPPNDVMTPAAYRRDLVRALVPRALADAALNRSAA